MVTRTITDTLLREVLTQHQAMKDQLELLSSPRDGIRAQQEGSKSQTDPDEELVGQMCLLLIKHPTRARDFMAEIEAQRELYNGRSQLESDLKDEKARYAAAQKEMGTKIQQLEESLREQRERDQLRYIELQNRFISLRERKDKEISELNGAITDLNSSFTSLHQHRQQERADFMEEIAGLQSIRTSLQQQIEVERDKFMSEIAALQSTLVSLQERNETDRAQLISDMDDLRRNVEPKSVNTSSRRRRRRTDHTGRDPPFAGSQTMLAPDCRYDSMFSLASHKISKGLRPTPSHERLAR